MRHYNYYQMPSRLISPELHDILMETERNKTRYRMWIVIVSSVIVGALVGGTAELFKLAPLWLNPIISYAALMVWAWFLDRRLHRKRR